MEIPEIVEFNGVTYRLMGAGQYYLSQSTTNLGRKHPQGLHVAIWEFYSGKKVPKGWDVHHKDGNTFHNEYDNLECLPKLKHRHEHLSVFLLLAAAWHRSDEGRAWHRQQACEVWENRQPHEAICQQCGTSFPTFRPAKYCSDLCGYRARRAAGLYTIEVTCVICGTVFPTIKPINPSRIASTCSRSCRRKLGAQRKIEVDE